MMQEAAIVLKFKENFRFLTQIKKLMCRWVSTSPSPPASPSVRVGIGEEGGVGVMTLLRLTVPTPGNNLSDNCLGVLGSSLRFNRLW